MMKEGQDPHRPIINVHASMPGVSSLDEISAYDNF